MKACDIELSLNDVLAKASKPLARKIEYSIDLIPKSEKMALRLDPENGFKWWISGKSYKQFYADEYQQLKIDFNKETE